MKSVLTSIVFLLLPAIGQGFTELYISEGVCPYEGCAYGEWKVRKETSVYAEQSLNSRVLGHLKPASKVIAITGNVHVIPGEAMTTGKPYHESPDLNISRPVLILDYVGEERIRVYQDGKFHITKNGDI